MLQLNQVALDYSLKYSHSAVIWSNWPSRSSHHSFQSPNHPDSIKSMCCQFLPHKELTKLIKASIPIYKHALRMRYCYSTPTILNPQDKNSIIPNSFTTAKLSLVTQEHKHDCCIVVSLISTKPIC
jgi:hypothetical protein